MNDAFINALNAQKSTNAWIDALTQNMANMYTPGYRESAITFKNFLTGTIADSHMKNTGQGKSIPGTSSENVFLEGTGYFMLRRADSRVVYSRLGEFRFDSEGVYKNPSGAEVQGFILNDKGEIMQGAKPASANIYEDTALEGGAINIPTTNIKMWIDPNNGKYLGKYEEFEIKDDGIIYGKSNSGKTMVPLYKIAVMNFHNPGGLYEVKEGEFIETEDSGKAVFGRADVRGGLLEQSNVDLKANISYYQQAKVQIDLSSKIISTNKQLLESALGLLS